MQIDIVCLPWDPGIEGVGSDQEKGAAAPPRDPQRMVQTRQHVEATHRAAFSHHTTRFGTSLRHFKSNLGGFPMSCDVHGPSRVGVRKHVARSTCSVVEPRRW